MAPQIGATRIDIGRLIDNKKMGGFHFGLLAVAFLVMAIDGYDIGAAAFAAPALAREFGVSRSAMGAMFSAGLFAGLFGPPLCGFLADRYGRRNIIVGASICFGAVTLLSVFITSFDQLVWLRFIAGLGISGVLPIMVSLVNEYAPRRWRASLVVIMFCGVTLGGGLPGVVSAAFMADYGWRLLFWIGGLAPIAIGLLMLTVPESLRFLALQPDRQADVRRVLRRMEPNLHIPADAVFVSRDEPTRKFAVRLLFNGRLAWLTPLLWMSNACVLMVFYFVNQWMPSIMSAAGSTPEQAALATTLFQFGGTLGGFAIMRPLDRWGFVPVPILFAIACPVVALIGWPGMSTLEIMALMSLAGFCLLGLQFGNIACEAMMFPTAIRSWGVGSCFAAGRLGSVFGPLLGGFLLETRIPQHDLFLLAALPLAVGCINGLLVLPSFRRQLAFTDAGLPVAAE